MNKTYYQREFNIRNNFTNRKELAFSFVPYGRFVYFKTRSHPEYHTKKIGKTWLLKHESTAKINNKKADKANSPVCS